MKTHPEISAEDRKRYEEQQRLSNQIVNIFERPDYKDDDAAANGEVLRFMTEVRTSNFVIEVDC